MGNDNTRSSAERADDTVDIANSEPTVIPSSEHPITLDMIDRDALFVLKTLNEAGFSGWLVGGGVRDLYLGKKPKDFDISTDARPGQLRKLFKRSTTIGRRFRLVQVFFGGGKAIEVSTLRSLSEHDLDGPVAVLAPNNTFGTLSEDARRRDLTINSLFYEIENETIVDYVHGTDDLKNGVIRVVGDPDRRFTHDPVRMMRAIRHATRNNFTIDEKCWQSILANADKLTLCPPSRLRDEFFKDLYSGASAAWFEMAAKSGIYTALFPICRDVVDDPTLRGQLAAIFATVDRGNRLAVDAGGHRPPDHFLLALTLIPWAEQKFQLFSVARRGAPLFTFTGIIREELDNTIGQTLNLRRSLRQEVTGLLLHLAQMLHNRLKEKEDETAISADLWPKWLQRKSYFAKALLFYRYWTEAATGTPCVPAPEPQEEQASRSRRGRRGRKKGGVARELSVPPGEESGAEMTAGRPEEPECAEKQPEKADNRVENGGRSRGGRVAWAPNTEGGVFGFRR